MTPEAYHAAVAKGQQEYKTTFVPFLLADSYEHLTERSVELCFAANQEDEQRGATTKLKVGPGGVIYEDTAVHKKL